MTDKKLHFESGKNMVRILQETGKNMVRIRLESAENPGFCVLKVPKFL